MKLKSALWMVTSSIFLIKEVLSGCGDITSALCDPRCNNVCAAEADVNACCNCVSTYDGIAYYFWKHDNDSATDDGARCYSSCPTKYYKDNSTSPHQCTDCASECQ